MKRRTAMKRFRWLILPLLATFISGCPLIQVAEHEAALTRSVEEKRIRAEAVRRVQGRWPTERAREADEAAYREAIRLEVEAIREEREREAREREERMRGGNGGGD
jgi:hypothetical protein